MLFKKTLNKVKVSLTQFYFLIFHYWNIWLPRGPAWHCVAFALTMAHAGDTGPRTLWTTTPTMSSTSQLINLGRELIYLWHEHTYVTNFARWLFQKISLSLSLSAPFAHARTSAGKWVMWLKSIVGIVWQGGVKRASVHPWGGKAYGGRM